MSGASRRPVAKVRAKAPGSILVATDFSRNAGQAALRALALADELGADALRLLHVVEAPWLGALQQWFGLADASQQGLVAEAQRSMAALVASIEARSGRRVAAEVAVGVLLDTVIERAAQADLLVIGARGQHPVRDFAIGTTGERLLRKRRGPLLVVRRSPARRYRRVLASVDFSVHAPWVLAQAATIAPAARIELLHAFELPFEGKLRSAGVPLAEIHLSRQQARAQAVERLAGVVVASGIDPVRVHRRIEHGYAPRVIVDAARESQADLIVIGKHGESIVEDLLLGSVTLHVLGEARCDVLVVSAPQPRRAARQRL
ncbi:MAG: universal stress protein [Burkholderiaceae bacterium]|nr:universal stress protein [Burkholderiaceae bacterium]